MKTSNGLVRLLIRSLIFSLILPGFTTASTYYVDQSHPSASDSNPGTESLPWLTIQHSAETMVAGDTVLIKDGVYNEHVFIENSGSASNHIVYSAYPGNTPIIDGTGVTEFQNGIVVIASYIKLLGLEVRNWEDNGIWVEQAAFIEFSDCEVHEVFYGIGIADGTHDFEINRCLAHHLNLYGFDVDPQGGADCYNGTFNECTAHTARDPQQNSDGFALAHGTQHDFTFNRCEAYGFEDGFAISSLNATLNRCSAHDCYNTGYKLWSDGVFLYNCIGYHNTYKNVELDWGEEGPGRTTLINCTFMDSGEDNIWIENAADTLHMYNCIMAGGDNIGLAFEQMGVGNYHGDYNVFHHNDPNRAIVVGYEEEFSLSQIESGEWTAYSGQDAHSLIANSASDIFQDAVNFDLHITASSPARDNGTATGAPDHDYDGNPRPSGPGYDIGAYEWQTTGIDTDTGYGEKLPRAFMLAQNYPNPFNPSTTISFDVPGNGTAKQHVTLTVYDIRGRLVRTLVSSKVEPGRYQVTWNGKDERGESVPSGIYLYTLKSGEKRYTRKMTILK